MNNEEKYEEILNLYQYKNLEEAYQKSLELIQQDNELSYLCVAVELAVEVNEFYSAVDLCTAGWKNDPGNPINWSNQPSHSNQSPPPMILPFGIPVW